MKIIDKRKAGETLGRGGISQRIIALATDMSSGSYKNAIQRAGQISVLVEAASYDEYWREKANIGRHVEESVLEHLNADLVSKEKIICG